MTGTPVVAGIDLHRLMSELAHRRPIFHSEADFQFALAQEVARLEPQARCRLEVPQPRRDGLRAEYLDLLVRGADGVGTAIELKYFTRAWAGTVADEAFTLRNHAATDLARLHYVHDIYRLEGFASASGLAGAAIMLTNDPRLWAAPAGQRRLGNDAAFRIHEGQVLSGTLEWGSGYQPNRRHLRGRYVFGWHDFSEVEVSSPAGILRWTVAYVPCPTGVTDPHPGAQPAHP